MIKCSFHTAAKQKEEVLTVIFLHGSRRRHEHRLWRKAVLLPPLDVFPVDDVKFDDLLGERANGKSGYDLLYQSTVFFLMVILN